MNKRNCINTKKLSWVALAAFSVGVSSVGMAADSDNHINLSDVNIAPPSSLTSGAQYRGISLAGGAFNGYMDTSQPPPAKISLKVKPLIQFFPRADDADIFLYKGMNTVRIPIAWEYLVLDKDGKDPAQFKTDNDYKLQTKGLYWLQLLTLIKNLQENQNLNIILDLHNYMRFNQDSPLSDVTDKSMDHVIQPTPTTVGGSRAPSTEAYGTLWGDIATALNAKEAGVDTSKISFELMNEPHHLPAGADGNKIMQDNYAAAIKQIRAAPSSAEIILDGRSWTGLHAWDKKNEGDNDWLKGLLTTLAETHENNNLTLDVHQYFDSNFSGTHNSCVKYDTLPDDYADSNVPTGGEGGKVPHGGLPLSAMMTTWTDHFTKYRQEHPLADGKAIPYILGEFGGYYDYRSPDKQYQCQLDATDMLNAIGADKSSTDPDRAKGFIWWAAGHAFNSEYPLNIAPGACHGNQYLYENSQGFDITQYLDRPEGIPADIQLPNETTFSGVTTAGKLIDKTDDFSIFPMHFKADKYPINYKGATCDTVSVKKAQNVYSTGYDGNALAGTYAQFGFYNSNFMAEYTDIGLGDTTKTSWLTQNVGIPLSPFALGPNPTTSGFSGDTKITGEGKLEGINLENDTTAPLRFNYSTSSGWGGNNSDMAMMSCDDGSGSCLSNVVATGKVSLIATRNNVVVPAKGTYTSLPIINGGTLYFCSYSTGKAHVSYSGASGSLTYDGKAVTLGKCLPSSTQIDLSDSTAHTLAYASSGPAPGGDSVTIENYMGGSWEEDPRTKRISVNSGSDVGVGSSTTAATTKGTSTLVSVTIGTNKISCTISQGDDGTYYFDDHCATSVKQLATTMNIYGAICSKTTCAIGDYNQPE